jgi:uncharacterized protein YegP (UPF0339 family)
VGIVREEEVGTPRGTRRSALADNASKFVLFWDMSNGRTGYRWRLCDATGQTMNWSITPYTDKAQCAADLEAMKELYPDVPVVDLTTRS